LRSKSTDSSRAAALGDLLEWVYADGQTFAVQEGYSELPSPMLAAVRKKIKDMQ
jgi:ABC-type phosphate transport system substrate-binding protein